MNVLIGPVSKDDTARPKWAADFGASNLLAYDVLVSAMQARYEKVTYVHYNVVPYTETLSIVSESLMRTCRFGGL